MATNAHQSARQSVDADRLARGKDEKSGWRHAVAIADSSGDVIPITLTMDGAIETWKQSAEGLDGYAQAA